MFILWVEDQQPNAIIIVAMKGKADMLLRLKSQPSARGESVLRDDYSTRVRIQKLIERIGGAGYSDSQPVQSIQVAGPVGRISYDEARRITEYRDARVGDRFGPPWSTFWFRLDITIPEAWSGRRIDLLWNSCSEAALWMNDQIVQGLSMSNVDRPDAVLLSCAQGGETVRCYVEMACNRITQQNDSTNTYNPAFSKYQLVRCDIAAFDREAWNLYFDATVLSQLESCLKGSDAAVEHGWQGYLLRELNRFANVIDLHNRTTWPEARQILTKLYMHRNASRVFRLSACGHSHIDTAWLWPLAETDRKCERTFSTAVAYMDEYPEYRFACSQAYQYDVIQKRNPHLFGRIEDAVRRGQWLPVGGAWVESDANIPSGESLCRQFLIGQTYFEKTFGIRCRECWYPDVFGCNGQLPQIMRQAGMKRFLTTKFSWNLTNKPQYSTFRWQGIDGTEVVAHFPPSTGYNDLTEVGAEIKCLRESMNHFKDHDRAGEAVSLFGYGDGGGGPTKRMLEILRRVQDLQSVPPTVQRGSNEFFDRIEADADHMMVRVGELYFEKHRGTYTSQALIKRNNRFAERLLHDIEFLASRRTVLQGEAYPTEGLDDLWKILLVNQFHDILPGTSINEVYRESEVQFGRFFERGKTLLECVLGSGSSYINTTGVCRTDVVDTGDGLQLMTAQPYATAQPITPVEPVVIEHRDEGYILYNANLVAMVNYEGRVTSLVDRRSGRNVIDSGGSVFELYEDTPNHWDAWDIDPTHQEKRRAVAPAHEQCILKHDSLRASICFTHRLSEVSTLRQTIRLDADARGLRVDCQVDWHESHTLLKVAVPVRARAAHATYETAFGHVQRPTHYNTPFDQAQFEVPMHRWFDLSEPGTGLAIANDCKYGGSVHENVMRLTLLRAPTHPDPTCDQGKHDFAFALIPHEGAWRDAGVLAQAIAFNHPLYRGQSIEDRPFLLSDSPNLVIDTIKYAQNGNGLIVRLFEGHGRSGQAKVTFQSVPERVSRSNTLEECGDAIQIKGDTLSLAYRSFELITLHCRYNTSIA